MSDKPKTPSQRLRHAFYRLWEKDHENMEFEVYYAEKMERLISVIVGRLDPPPPEHE